MIKNVRYSLLATVALVACAPHAYLEVRGGSSVHYSATMAAVTKRGLEVSLDQHCTRRIIENWCRPGEPTCAPQPITVRNEAEDCAERAPVTVDLRAPWGAHYSIESAEERVEVPIDWSTTGIDPVGKDAAAALRKPWHIRVGTEPEGRELELDEVTTAAMLEAIGTATDTYTIAADAQGTTLEAKLLEPANAANQLAVAITNTGKAPAYRVIVQLRSSYSGAHGLQLSFGKILPNETKTRAQSIPAPLDAADRTPLVVAEIHSANAVTEPVHRRLSLRLAAVLQHPTIALACTAPQRVVAPGQRARLECELANSGEVPADDLAYEVAVDNAKVAVDGPRHVGAKQRVKIDLLPLVPDSAKAASRLKLVASVLAAGEAMATAHEVTVDVQVLSTMCKAGTLTRDEYARKVRSLQDAAAQGSLTQDELDRYEQDLIVCLK